MYLKQALNYPLKANSSFRYLIKNPIKQSLLSLVFWKDFCLKKMIGIYRQHWKLLSLSWVCLHLLRLDEEYNLSEMEFV